ncbi:unnamed protein product [Cylicocyclus nassatus]|uniref:Uncharacterized protein n=1 Tax=Cylicocyclus nassatus TaxID=53992 RepID=A0AA36M0H6_CYLNA|nr:unnamed protein product [Cylicocyclus nassatus]
MSDACIANVPKIVHSPLWLTATISQSVFSVLTLVVSIFFLRRLRDPTIFSFSTIALLTLAAVFANVHALDVIGIHTHHFVLSSLYNTPCELTLRTRDCAFANYMLICCIIGMVSCQNMLWIDRALATACPSPYHKRAKPIGFALAALVILTSFLVPFLILRNDPYDDYVITCFNTPRGSAAQVNDMFYSLICLNFVAVIANAFLFFVNKQKERMLRFNVSHRYLAYENTMVSKWIGLIAVTQFVVMTTYSSAMYAIRTTANMPDVLRANLRTGFYLVPLSTFMLPLISIVALRCVSQRRQSSITRLTHEQVDQTAYMSGLEQMWNKT